MQKTTELWEVSELAEKFNSINFADYQREPTVWSLDAKRRLIDSISRRFDIASIYLYQHDEATFDCIDGRQRINAIMSFLGQNEADDKHNGFEFRPDNEIRAEDDHPFATLHRKKLDEIKRDANDGDPICKNFLETIMGYQITIVLLSGSRRPEEFNLQFTRLNLGTIINSGERLNAMVGDLRNECFEDGGLGKHPFFASTNIQTRRFAREQVAAQLLLQLFSLEKNETFTRTRNLDMSRAFKEHEVLGARERKIIGQLRPMLNLLNDVFADRGLLRNRAMTVSTVLLAWQRNIRTSKEAQEFVEFIEGFACRLRWQIKKGLYPDREYQFLIDFQRHLTQASVERPAVAERARILSDSLNQWKKDKQYPGDQDYIKTHKEDPAKVCAEHM